MPMDKRDDSRPVDRKRDDAIEFIQELTGLPARSIGSQIAVTPSTPQPSSPLASVGQGPAIPSVTMPAVADATGVIDVSADFELPQPPDSIAEQPPLATPSIIPESLDFDGAANNLPPVTPATPATPQYDIPENVSPRRYDGPMDMAVVNAGGNPMLARRTDLSHDEKMVIANRVTAVRERKASDRQDRRDARDNPVAQTPQPLSPAPEAASPAPATNFPSGAAPIQPTEPSGPEVVYATSLVNLNPDEIADSAPPESAPPIATDSEQTQSDVAPHSEPIDDASRSSVERPAAPEPVGDGNSSPTNPFATAPMTAASIERIRQQVTQDRNASTSSRFGATGSSPSPPPSPSPSQIPPQSGPSRQPDDSYMQPMQMAEDVIENHNDLIGMIIDCLSRLTAAYDAHRSRLSTILDRLDSEANVDEYNEGGSQWLG